MCLHFNCVCLDLSLLYVAIVYKYVICWLKRYLYVELTTLAIAVHNFKLSKPQTIPTRIEIKKSNSLFSTFIRFKFLYYNNVPNDLMKILF